MTVVAKGLSMVLKIFSMAFLVAMVFIFFSCVTQPLEIQETEQSNSDQSEALSKISRSTVGFGTTLMQSPICIFACEVQKAKCEKRNDKAGRDDVIRPCELFYDVCVDDCANGKWPKYGIVQQ